MPDHLIESNHADIVVASLKKYYALARPATVPTRQTIIQDETLKKIFTDFSANPTPEMSLYFCKILIVLSDDPKNAYLMNKEGYTQMIGTICEQQIPPKLVDKLLRVQTRLMKAQESGDDTRAIPEKKPKRNKELTFILPILNQQLQGKISQTILQVEGCISISFRTNNEKEQMEGIVRCRAYVEARKIANQITNIEGINDVGYLFKNDDGKKEVFTFYRDENSQPSPEKLPQYLDDNIEYFDPATAVVTNDFKTTSKGWFSSFSFW